jgi:hypothetical protein
MVGRGRQVVTGTGITEEVESGGDPFDCEPKP